MKNSTPRLAALALSAFAIGGCSALSEGVGWLQKTFHEITRWPEGHVMREGEVINGEQEGDWVYFHANGTKRTEGSFVLDRQEGEWVQWFENGNEEWRGEFREGCRSGLWTYGHPSGNKRAQGHFDTGRETGQWTFWTPESRMSQRGDFDGGRLALRWTYWHADGTKKAEGYYREGSKVGLWRYWDASGSLSEKVHPLPEGWTIVRENWEDGTPKREGFLFEGTPTGPWVTWHPNGTRRTTGKFTAGQPDGIWMLHDDAGDLVAKGPVEGGRPKGEWQVFAGGESKTWTADGMAPLPPLTGEWSEGAVGEQRIQDVIGRWVAEASALVPSDAQVALSPQTGAKPDPTLERETTVKPKVPIRAQPWTWREEQSKETYLKSYSLGATPAIQRRTSGRYGPRTKSSGPPRGDLSKSEPLIGKRLPKESFIATDGSTVDLEQYRGKRVAIVLLRGYFGRVCIYCALQTKALADASERVAELGAEVLIVYPGPESSYDAFIEAYLETFDGEGAPTYPILYDPELELARKLGLAGDLAIPSTLILDENGVTRWAYVGETIDDRASAALILEALEKLNDQT